MPEAQYVARAANGSAVASRLAEQYLTALLAGDARGAAAAVDAARREGLGFHEVLLEVLLPAQREMGGRWERGEVSVAQEHWATEVTTIEVARLRLTFPAARDLGLRAVVAAPEGERHSLAAVSVAALLAWQGWRVDPLGADLPAADLAAFVAARRADLVALSVTLPANLPHAAVAANAVAALVPTPALLLGGAAFGSPPALPPGFPSAAVAADALSGVRLAEELVTRRAGPDLTSYLATVGARIQELRRLRGMSQANLGEAADLTRSYLSAVEQGRQNITLDAALRLAGALRVGVAELLSEAPGPPRV
jgi:methanogenic corrinoid protein MtbC1/DNA-binding XRE family transcriptional regulator